MAFDCIEGISQNLVNSCENPPILGLGDKAYFFNYDELTATKSLTLKSLVTDLAVAIGKKGFTAQGHKKSMNAKNELVPSDQFPDTYKQTFDFVLWAKDAATVDAILKLNKVVVVIERDDKGVAGNSAFAIYGLDTPLYKVTTTQEDNVDNGVFKLSLAAENQRVPYYSFFDTDYATSKATLEALLVVQV